MSNQVSHRTASTSKQKLIQLVDVREIDDQLPQELSVNPKEIHARVSSNVLCNFWDIYSYRGRIPFQIFGKSRNRL